MWYTLALKIMLRSAAKDQTPGSLIGPEGSVTNMPNGWTHQEYIHKNSDKYVLPEDGDPDNDPDYLPAILRQNRLIRTRHFLKPYGNSAHNYELPDASPKSFEMAQKHYLKSYKGTPGNVNVIVNGSYFNIENPEDDWYSAYYMSKRRGHYT